MRRSSARAISVMSGRATSCVSRFPNAARSGGARADFETFGELHRVDTGMCCGEPHRDRQYRVSGIGYMPKIMPSYRHAGAALASARQDRALRVPQQWQLTTGDDTVLPRSLLPWGDNRRRRSFCRPIRRRVPPDTTLTADEAAILSCEQRVGDE